MAGGVVCPAVAAAVMTMTAPTAASTLPSRMWLGVERIVLTCEIEGPLDAAARRDLCLAFARAADGMTAYPVSTDAPPPDSDPEASKVLVLRLFVRADSDRPATVEAASRAERHGLTRLTGRTTQFLPVALSWQGEAPVLAGPVAPLALHLSPPLPPNRGIPRG